MIVDHLESNNGRQEWQGVHHLTNYKINLRAAENDVALAEELNIFFAHFEVTVPEVLESQHNTQLTQHHPHPGGIRGEAHT